MRLGLNIKLTWLDRFWAWFTFYAPSTNPLNPDAPKRITIHCTATTDFEYYPASKIDQYHKSLGWDEIGYHMVIQPTGEVETGRSLNKSGAHVAGQNDRNCGIALVGTSRFTREQFISLRYQLDSLRSIYEIEPWEIRCHSQYDSAIKQGKTCPNMEINKLLSWYLMHDWNAIGEYF